VSEDQLTAIRRWLIAMDGAPVVRGIECVERFYLP
jgi:hypothetical protein